MATRRERLRRELIRDIKATALAHLRERGPDGLSLRAVARDLGISAPGLYRYYAGRDDLLTALIADSYDDLADHLLAALGAEEGTQPEGDQPSAAQSRSGVNNATPGARMARVCRAYRSWSLAHPHEFGLIYGDPIPGYAAPEGGVTVQATRRVAEALLRPLVEGWRAGTLVIPAAFEGDLGAGAVALRDDIATIVSDAVPVPLGAYAMSLWAWLHGSVSLEVFGQFDWIYPDGAEPLFEAALQAQLTAAGLHTDHVPA